VVGERAVERAAIDAGPIDDPAAAVVGEPQVNLDGLLDECGEVGS
jgi:hypothetical protein